jgi:hypothetical protein
MSATCSVCTSPTDLRLCTSCLSRLTADLRSLLPREVLVNDRPVRIPGLVEDLEVTLTRQARIGERSGPRSSEVPLPYHSAASVDLETLRDGLSLWCKTIAGARGVVVDAEHEPGALAKWLLRWSGEIARHDDAAELYGDIRSMIRAAERTVDLPAEKRYIGPCDGVRATTEVKGCGADLYVMVRPGQTPEYVTCSTEACGGRYPMQSRRAWLLEQAVDRLLTAAEMSRAIRELIPGKPISPNLISQWASRGLRGRRLTPYLPHPRDPHKRTRYRVGEVIEFAHRVMSQT